MVDSRFLITLSSSSDFLASTMAESASFASKGNRLHLPNKTHQIHKNKRLPNPQSPIKTPPCHRSQMAVVDMAVLIAVLFACGFLVFPYLNLFCYWLSGFFNTALSAKKIELGRASCACLALGIGFLVLVIGMFQCATCRKCDNPECRGLKEAAEFDIKIETEECLKNSGALMGRDDVGKGFFELSEDNHRELGAELRKIAPLNGRAVIIFRAKCGCSVGRMVVWGQKKLRKMKK